MIQPFRRRLRQSGPVLSDHARLWLAILIMAVVALIVAWAATAPAEGDPIPTHSIRSR